MARASQQAAQEHQMARASHRRHVYLRRALTPSASTCTPDIQDIDGGMVSCRRHSMRVIYIDAIGKHLHARRPGQLSQAL